MLFRSAVDQGVDQAGAGLYRIVLLLLWNVGLNHGGLVGRPILSNWAGDGNSVVDSPEL